MNFKKIAMRILGSLFLISVLTLMAACSNTENPSKEVAATPELNGENLAVPERTPNLMGRVVEVIGNEVTVYKMEADLAQRTPGAGGEGNQRASVSATAGNQRPQMLASGEKEAFVIPVGTPIVSVQRGNSIQLTTVELTEIKKDQILRVWKDEGIVEFVQLMSTSGNRGAGGNTGGQNQGQGGFLGMPPGGGGGGGR